MISVHPVIGLWGSTLMRALLLWRSTVNSYQRPPLVVRSRSTRAGLKTSSAESRCSPYGCANAGSVSSYKIRNRFAEWLNVMRAGEGFHHSVDQQLCRWLLLSLDRLSANRLTMTQALIANMLGVRRKGVTEAVGSLQKLGVIEYSRGEITVLDRPKLEALCCECYAVVRKESDHLLPRPHSNPPLGPQVDRGGA